MIRINLLEETRTQARKSRGGGMAMPSLDVAENVGVVVMFVGILAAIAFVTVWFLLRANTIAALNDDIAEAREEVARLEYVLKRNDELKAKKKELEHRIEIISTLKQNQDKPVRMMKELSRELADNVWFEDLTFTGDKLTLKGKAISKFAYSKFLGNLERSDHFADVATGIISEEARPEGQPIVTFQADAIFVPEGKAAREAAEKEAAGGSQGGRQPPGRGRR